MLRDQFNLNMEIKTCSKCIGLVAAQVIIEACSKLRNYPLHPLYIHTHISVRACRRAGVRACRRAGVQACGRASVDKNEFKRGVISVRAWSVKRAGVEWQSYKARLLYMT